MTFQSDQEAYATLSYYTLAHPDPAFIHQNIVDAFTAQHAGPDTKPIAITFALIGLYLAVEKSFTGKQVQQVHMSLAKSRKHWPAFMLPENRGDITVFEVISRPAGKQRDAMIHQWCVSVWNAYHDSQQQVRDLVNQELHV